MQNRIRRVFNRVRERTCVSYAKVATMGGLCDVDLIIIKATPHDDFPLPERYVHDLLKIFAVSPASYSAFAVGFARRLRRTQSWRVALKCLLLLHRLLVLSAAEHAGLRAELLWTRTNGILSLYPCNFRDCTSSASDDYTAFVRSYARLLDEALILEIDENEEKLDDLGRTIETLPQIQSLIDRAIDCWPTGAASRSFLVQCAMKHVIRDSYFRYAAFRREMESVLENLNDLPYRSCASAFAIYKKAAAQAEILAGFHAWCKNMGYCGRYEYPYIDRIPQTQIQSLETFLKGMWQLTDQSSDTNLSDEKSSSESSKDDTNFSGEEALEVEPLIKWEDEEGGAGGGWEDLLEASIGCDKSMGLRNGWQIEVYNPYGFQTPNPFYQQPNGANYVGYGSCPNTPLQHTWRGAHGTTCV